MGNVAVMAWVPGGRAEVLKRATPVSSRSAEPRSSPFSRKVTEPAGTGPLLATVAVKVTEVSGSAGLAEEESVVAVAARDVSSMESRENARLSVARFCWVENERYPPLGYAAERKRAPKTCTVVVPSVMVTS
jgi:hypothetical protein